MMFCRYKLYISSILEAEKSSEKNGYYVLGKNFIKDVDIMGSVTEVKEYPKFMVTSVDDGTGVISCKQNLDHMELIDGKEREMKEESRVIWKHLLRETPVPFHVNKGDTIHAQGTITEFRGKKELRVEKIKLVKNVNEEIHRVFELESLYRNIYDLSQ